MRARALILWSELALVEATAPAWPALAAGLPASMRIGIENSVREGDRRLRLLARLLLARALAHLAGEGPHELAFDRRGRPEPVHGLDLSISHTDGLACAAVGLRCRIGVDVEARRAIEPSLHDRVLAPEERRLVACSTDPDRDFLTFWTMKEAAAKADGRGLHLDPSQLLCRRGSAFRRPTVRVESIGYGIRALPLPPAWIGSLAYASRLPLQMNARAYSFS